MKGNFSSKKCKKNRKFCKNNVISVYLSKLHACAKKIIMKAILGYHISFNAYDESYRDEVTAKKCKLQNSE